jgi:hypothetical protein
MPSEPHSYPRITLLIGAALIGGCFFAGSSAGYRGINLLFTLPAILTLARMGHEARVRTAAVQGGVLVMRLFNWLEGRPEWRHLCACSLQRIESA